jgi:hypothetical protein
MSGVCGIHGRKGKCVKRKDYMGNPQIHATITLKCCLNKDVK